jgi:hypothetical protein
MSIRDARNDWIYKVREEIYEKTKKMSPDEFQNYFTNSAEEAAKKYGFTIARSLETKEEYAHM